MRQVTEEQGRLIFRGTIENADDLLAALAIAARCDAYSIDEDDEDYCEGVRTCFNCRYRRWLTDGFQCLKNRLPTK
jgi:hypothetical protein